MCKSGDAQSKGLKHGVHLTFFYASELVGASKYLDPTPPHPPTPYKYMLEGCNYGRRLYVNSKPQNMTPTLSSRDLGVAG